MSCTNDGGDDDHCHWNMATTSSKHWDCIINRKDVVSITHMKWEGQKLSMYKPIVGVGTCITLKLDGSVRCWKAMANWSYKSARSLSSFISFGSAHSFGRPKIKIVVHFCFWSMNQSCTSTDRPTDRPTNRPSPLSAAISIYHCQQLK